MGFVQCLVFFSLASGAGAIARTGAEERRELEPYPWLETAASSQPVTSRPGHRRRDTVQRFRMVPRAFPGGRLDFIRRHNGTGVRLPFDGDGTPDALSPGSKKTDLASPDEDAQFLGVRRPTPAVSTALGAPKGQGRRVAGPAPAKAPSQESRGLGYPVTQGSKPNGTGSVRVKCGDKYLRVEVERDFWGTGTLLGDSELSLGSGCSSNGRKRKRSKFITFTYELHACGTRRQITDAELVYFNRLYYTPRVGRRRSRTQVATLQCHYARTKTVSSHGVKPTWAPVSSRRSSSSHFAFSFGVMTDDWKPSSKTVYFLGQTINLQVSVRLQARLGFKVYIDSCVATTTQSVDSKPSYSIIQDYGCLVDSRLTHSTSKFMSPRSNSTLQFQIKAFQFENSLSDKIFIHCRVWAVDAKAPPSEKKKSCQYNQGDKRWEELEGQDGVCGCCERRSCGRDRWSRSPEDHPDGSGSWNPSGALGDVTVGPLRILAPRSNSSVNSRESRPLWHDANLTVAGDSGMQLAQLLIASASAVCGFSLLMGLFCLCRLGCRIPRHPSLDSCRNTHSP
ncbi:zona pellucida sperm-binding protein 3-like [Lepisosteus oculatus]|uniref:zona pellucida sperm-binding protein 3-like n=1 Tax=Lepisosteus oculatus TaxID=7918 RepID=UPI0037139B9D